MEDNDKYQSTTADQDLPQTVPPEQQELDNLKRDRDDLFDRLLRKQAEFDNFRKRVEKEKSEFMQFASAELIKEMLTGVVFINSTSGRQVWVYSHGGGEDFALVVAEEGLGA